MAGRVNGRVSKRRGRPHPKQLMQADFPYTMRLRDGRTVCVEIPGRWMSADRDGTPAFLPPAVAFLDRIRALFMSLRDGPPSPGFITALREALGLTQEDLGAKLGVDRMSVSRWERGQIRPSKESLAALESVRSEAVRKGVVIPS